MSEEKPIMQVAVLHGPGDLRLNDAQRPVAGPSDIVVKVRASGICGTDLHFRHMGPRFPEKPMALGHEWAGEVIEAGRDVKSYKIGDRVAYNSNNSPADMGRGGECGGFSNYVALREVDGHVQSLCKVPDNVSLDHAALVEPLSVAAHGVNRGDAKPGESVAVFGTGPIGLGVIIYLRQRGVTDIIAFEPSPLRRERALVLGARAVFDPREKPPGEVLKEMHGKVNVWGFEYPKTSLYFEVSGARGVLSNLLELGCRRSRIVVIAMQREPVTFDASRLMSKEVSLIGASGYPTEFPEVMDKLASGEIDPEAMVTHRFPFNDFLHAFEVADNADDAAKVVLTFD
jgi:2-desacetyl-2-hydroxyethyl bacteriochlorophyllide A dehydrogenase